MLSRLIIKAELTFPPDVHHIQMPGLYIVHGAHLPTRPPPMLAHSDRKLPRGSETQLGLEIIGEALVSDADAFCHLHQHERRGQIVRCEGERDSRS